MAVIDYVRKRERADAAITRAGQSGFLRRTAAGSGTDPWNPGSGSVTDYPIMFVLDEYAERDRDGTLIRQSDSRAYIRAGGLPVDATDADRLVDSQGREFEIVTMRPLEPGGVTLLYECQVRR